MMTKNFIWNWWRWITLENTHLVATKRQGAIHLKSFMLSDAFWARHANLGTSYFTDLEDSIYKASSWFQMSEMFLSWGQNIQPFFWFLLMFDLLVSHGLSPCRDGFGRVIQDLHRINTSVSRLTSSTTLHIVLMKFIERYISQDQSSFGKTYWYWRKDKRLEDTRSIEWVT